MLGWSAERDVTSCVITLYTGWACLGKEKFLLEINVDKYEAIFGAKYAKNMQNLQN